MDNRIALGTVQFGMDYGINNDRGRVPRDEVFDILDRARRSGISTLDTSRDYGESESVIGDYMRQSGAHFDIVSKMPAGGDLNIEESVALTLRCLGVDSLYGYLLRGYDYFEKNPAIWNRVQELKSNGKVKKVGFTLYRVEEIEKIRQKGLSVDLVQVPYSIFDRRFESAIEEMALSGVEIHVRSVFLQGLVFQNPASLHERFQKIRNRIQRLGEIAREEKMSIAGLCINYVMANKCIDRVLVGVDSIQNFKGIIESTETEKMSVGVRAVLDEFIEDDESITLPINWDGNVLAKNIARRDERNAIG